MSKTREPRTIGDFVVKASGLFFKNGEKEERVCDAIWHLGNGERENGSDAADIVECTDRVFRVRELTIYRRDSLGRAPRLFEKLANYGFDVPGPRQCELLLRYLAECGRHSKKRYLFAGRMGWHGTSFVIGADVISGDAVGVRLEGPIASNVEKFGQSGTLEEYQNKILLRTRHSSRLMMGIALALAAPLARLLSIENGGINFVGSAGIGKTTILRTIGSFWGGGTSPYFTSWHMTDNAPKHSVLHTATSRYCSTSSMRSNPTRRKLPVA
jgi:putative DNA primase/helicase